jgi:DedD protein
MSAQGRVYTPNAESSYEAGVGSDPATLAIMGMTFIAMAGAAVQAFEGGPAPVISAPEGPLKTMLVQPQPQDDLSDSVYAAMQGLPLADEAAGVGPSGAAGVPLAEAAAAPAAQDPARFAIQLGAFASEAAARERWRELVAGAPPELLETEIAIERVEEGGSNGVLYRLRTGPIGSRVEASRLCERLDRRGVPCMAAAL